MFAFFDGPQIIPEVAIVDCEGSGEVEFSTSQSRKCSRDLFYILVRRLHGIFAWHVQRNWGIGAVDVFGLRGASDRAIWERGGADGYVLVTKDGDFHRLSVFLGPPPKVVWLRLGNGHTAEVAHEEARRTLFGHAESDPR